MARILLVLFLAFPLAAAAQIFRTTDEQGNVVFTDKPPVEGGNVEKVELNRTNTAPPPPEVIRPEEPELDDEPEALEYSVAIVTPANETTIAMGPGNFLLSAEVNPTLAAGETLQLHMDGTPWGPAQEVASWSLTNVFRGAHDLTVSILDVDGTPLATSDPVRVYVLRPSIHNRNR